MHRDQDHLQPALNALKILTGTHRDSFVRAIVIAAHPDDEVAGAGSRFPLLNGAEFIHITDGAPRNMVDAAALGFQSRHEYAYARRRELCRALELASIRPDQCTQIGLADQDTPFHMHYLVYTISGLLLTSRPDFVLTPAYEGGHPDHDTAAFVTHAACRLLSKSGTEPPPLIEYALYHGNNGQHSLSTFLPAPGYETVEVLLSDQERHLKQRMLDCFETQKKVLAAFSTNAERFRPAPAYDFTQPPHPGPLHYEHFNWGMTGERWRLIAVETMDALEIRGMI